MGYRVVDAAEFAAAPGPHPAASAYDRGVGAALGVGRFGIYQVELPRARRPSRTTTRRTAPRTSIP